MEAIIFSRNHWPVVEIIPFSGNCSFYWKTFPLLEAIPFMEVIHLSENHSF